MTRATVLLTTLLGALSLSAVAQDDQSTMGNDSGTTGGGTMGGASQTQTFTELDGNNDGVLDQDELENANVGSFEDIDTNGDDEVDRNEYYQHQRNQR